MKRKQVIKYLKRQAQKFYKNDDLINYQYIKNTVLVLEGLQNEKK